MRRLPLLVIALSSCTSGTAPLEPGSRADAAVATAADARAPDAAALAPDAAQPADGGIADSGAGGPVCSSDGWCWALRTPQGLTLNDVWGTGPNNVFAVGVGGVVLRFDGAFWSAQASSTTADLYALWGSAPDDIWAVGDQTILHFNGTAWLNFARAPVGVMRAVWGSAPNAVWAVGNEGLTKWNGVEWSAMEPIVIGDRTYRTLRDVWGTGADDVWIVAAGEFPFNASLLHWDGLTLSVTGEWEGHIGPVPVAIFGTSADDVIAIGTAGSRGSDAALRWNGTTWSPQSVGQRSGFSALWGSAASDVWAVGASDRRAAIERWDGVMWSAYTIDAAALTSVWGSGPSDVFAVGEAGTILHFDGTTWTPTSRGLPDGAPSRSAQAIWSAGPNDVWIAGDGAILRWDGTVARTSLSAPHTFEGLWGSGPSDVWAVGSAHFPFMQSAAKRWDGSAWIDMPLTLPSESHVLHAVWGTSSSNVFAVGEVSRIGDERPLVLRWNGSSWSEMLVDDMSPARRAPLQGVWGSGPNDVWAVGTIGDFSTSAELIEHFDGTAWSRIQLGLAPADRSLEAVWGSGPNDVWAVGARSEGRMGERALILHWDGERWSEVDTASMPPLRAVTGRGPNDVAVAGIDGTVWRWNGAGWTSSSTGIPGSRVEALSFTERALWAVGFRFHESVSGGDWVVLRAAR